ncbi:MAG: AsmA family protein [Alphaproteobacteria bacterium]
MNGRIAYRDAVSGTLQVIENINLTVALPSFTSPLEARGSLVWNKEKIDLSIDIANPDAFLKGESTGLQVQVSAAPVNLGFRGNAASGKALKAAGDIDLNVPSVRKLAAWAGQPMDAPGTGFGPMKIAGRVSVDGQKYAFTRAKLNFDAIEGAGDFRYDGSGRLPYVSARLDTGMIDINPYLPPENPANTGTAVPGGAPAGGSPGAAKTARPGQWSDAPIDLSALRSVNADAALNVAGLKMRKISIGKSAVKVALKGGRLTTDLTEMALYDGNGKARVTVDAAGATPAIAASMDLSGLQANPALSDAIDFTRIEGTLSTDLSVATRGKSQRAMISALGGKGRFRFNDGAIRGINIGAMVRNVATAFLDPSARESQKTDFAELSGSFDIVRGILRNNDLTLQSPLLRVAGKGSVDLPARTVSYRVEPKVVASAEGQGGKSDASGIKVPVIVSGPWHDISYKPDLAGALGGIAKDPKKALDTLKDLIPGSKSSGGGASPNPVDTLKKLFGR